MNHRRIRLERRSSLTLDCNGGFRDKGLQRRHLVIIMSAAVLKCS